MKTEIDLLEARGLLQRLSAEELEALVKLVTQLVWRVFQSAGSAGGDDSVGPGEGSGGTGTVLLGVGTNGMTTRPTDGRHRFTGRVLVEDDVRAARRTGCACLLLPRGAVISPLALDTARELHIEIVRE
jgi:hypothetical protein